MLHQLKCRSAHIFFLSIMICVPSESIPKRGRERERESWYRPAPQVEKMIPNMLSRQLLPIGLWDSICSVHGLLPHSDLHPIQSYRSHLLGVLLAQQGRYPSASDSGRDHSAHHDHPYGIDQLSFAQSLVCQVNWRLPGVLFLHGFCLTARYVSFKHK